MKSQLLTIFEITETHIKLLESLVKGGRQKPFRYEGKKVEDSSEEGIAKILASFADSKIKKSCIVAVIPRQQAMLRYFTLPSHDEEELCKMVDLQIARQIPYTKEDVVFDFSIVQKESNGYSKVLAVILHKEVTGRFLRVFRQNQLFINRFTLSSIAIANWFYQNERKSIKDCCAVLNIDTLSSEICFIHQGKLLFSRHIPFGVKDFGADNENLFMNEIRLTLDTYQKEKMGISPEKIVLLASQEIAGEFSQKLIRLFQLPVELIDPYENIPSGGRMVVPRIARGDYYSPVVCFGAVQKGPQKSFNLLPRDVSAKRQEKEKKRVYIKTAVLFLLAIALGFSAFFWQIQKKKIYLNKALDQMKSIDARIEDIERKKTHIQFIENYLDKEPLAMDLIDSLYRLLPEEASIRFFSFSEDGTVVLQGIATNLSSVSHFQKNLVDSSFFKNVNLKYASKRRITKGEITDFKITAEVVR